MFGTGNATINDGFSFGYAHVILCSMIEDLGGAIWSTLVCND